MKEKQTLKKNHNMKVTRKKVTTVTETVTYHICDNIRYVIVHVNGKEKFRELRYAGGNINGYPVSVGYDRNLSLLEDTNPYWNYKETGWELSKTLPEPEDIDIEKIILEQGSTHEFFKANLEPIPVVVSGNYIDAGIRSENYDLEGLHEYFSKHSQVKKITDIELIPYYNNDSGMEKCFEVLVLPSVEQLKVLKNKRDIFYKPWHDTDYLGMKPFWIRKDDDY
jgi:hypothetical protein